MAIDNRLQIFDENGNPVDYDIMATDVKFADGKDLPTKLDELEDEIGEGGYTPPPGGIPKTDLAPAVQQTLDDVANKVDKVAGYGLSSNDYADTDKAKVDNLKPVATSGSYNDLTDKPTIPTVPTMDSQPTAGNTTHMVSSDGVAAAIANAGSVKSVSINGNPAVYPNGNGNVNLGNVVGAQGPKGDTGNVQVDGNGNVLIVNNVDDGGTGAALSAEMGKRLALKSGTFAAAWARAQVIPVPFSFLWIENVSGVLVRKPIWHIGNSVFVDAAGGAVSVAASAVPNAPTFSETSGSTIGKNTQLTITPYADSALYYKIDNGNWIISDVAVTITITATCTITAKCVNNAGSSSEVQCALTVSGPQVPQFAAADGTTIGTGNVVSRGGSIVVSVPEGGELHYSTDGENYTTASGLSVTIPVPAAGVHIWAYNIEDGEQSATRDVAYTMAALAAPVFSKTGQLDENGEDITITNQYGSGVSVYYTEDGSDPDNTSTLYTGVIRVESSKTIKARAYDAYGSSAVTSAQFTIPVVPKLRYKIEVPAGGATGIVAPFLPNEISYKYTCKIDWGDGTTPTELNKAMYNINGVAANKHDYAASDTAYEVTIKITGTVIPIIQFDTTLNIGKVVAILENSLTCNSSFSIINCPNIKSISADTFSNNIARSVVFRNLGSGLSSPFEFPAGLLNNLTKNVDGLSSCKNMFNSAKVNLTAERMNELKQSIANVTSFESMFLQFRGTCVYPVGFFTAISGKIVTTVQYMMHNLTSSGGSIQVYNTETQQNGSGSDIYKDLTGNGNAENSKMAEGAVVSGALTYFVSDTTIPSDWRNA